MTDEFKNNLHVSAAYSITYPSYRHLITTQQCNVGRGACGELLAGVVWSV